MAAPGLKRLASFVLVAAVGAAGYLAGVRQGQLATFKALQTEAAANLTQRIEALSLLHLRDASTAIMRLEEDADSLALSMAANPGVNRHALAIAKAYRTAVPPPASRQEELAAAFEGVPDLEPGQCGAALRQLLLNARQ